MMTTVPPLPVSATALLEVFRGEFFTLYNVEDRDLTEVMAIMQARHGINASRKEYNTKITAWSFGKRCTRAQVMEFLRELRLVRDGKPLPARSSRRPLDVQRIKSYCLKNRVELEAGLWDYADLHEKARAIWLTAPRELILDDGSMRPAEELLHQCQSLVKTSFESGQWHSASPEQIITSSSEQLMEVKSLHTFLGQVEVASKAASQGDYSLAMTHWQSSFDEIENIVSGRYHDHIPNLIQTLSDLWTAGHQDVARPLANAISEWGRHYSRQEASAFTAAFALFASLDLETIVELEERLMKIFAAVFELYLGKRNYNAFVMRINSAKRKLIGQSHADPGEWIPNISSLDQEFGPANRRSLEAIRLHVEILHARMQYTECEAAAVLLIRRALMIEEDEDPWQRLHFLTKGQYYLGACQYVQGNYLSAAHHLKEAQKTERKFLRVEPADIFFAERNYMEKMMANIRTAQSEHVASV